MDAATRHTALCFGLAVTVLSAAAALAQADRIRTAYSVSGAGAGELRIHSTFRHFSRETVTVSFGLDARAVDQSMGEFGSAQGELDALLQECTKSQCSQARYDASVEDYYGRRALTARRMPGGGLRLSVDIPANVTRNRARVLPLARALEQLSLERGFGPEDTFGAAVAFVQTALEYRRPPKQEHGRNILSFYPPPRALAAGSGDCDTKSALLAAVMSNFGNVRMVGIHVPGHYLVGIARVPRAGDAYIEYRGEPFVLVEAAGPAWLPPGMIADTTQLALNTMDGVRIDPLF